MSPVDQELQAWRDNAGHWIRNAGQIGDLTRPATEALVERLSPSAGQRILDVASGAGDPALLIARHVGPEGHVTATDGVEEMLATLRADAARQGLQNVSVLAATAEDLRLPAAAFDAACSRFGVMFFADAGRALANMRRAVRPGGRLVVVAWGARESNPFFTLTMDALDGAGGAGPSLPPGTRTVFEYSEPGRLLALAAEAGWQQAVEERRAFRMRLAGVGPEGLLDALASLSRRVADRIATLAPAVVRDARAAVAARAAPHAVNGDIVLPAEVLVVWGRA